MRENLDSAVVSLIVTPFPYDRLPYNTSKERKPT